jgi:hypothetical protein
MAALGKFVLYTALWFPAIWLRAFTLAKLYAWFVVPAFHVEPIRLPVAYGIGMLIQLMTYQLPKNMLSDKDKDPAWSGLAAGSFVSAFVLGVGWCIQRWWL